MQLFECLIKFVFEQEQQYLIMSIS